MVCNIIIQASEYIVPLELEGAELPLYKVAVQHLLIPKGRYPGAFFHFPHFHFEMWISVFFNLQVKQKYVIWYNN